MTARPFPGAIDGEAFLALLVAASAYLDASAPAVDAINVYPVPDGDTGSNMAATLREAAAGGASVAPPRDLPAVLAGVARGALYGARGNSGVILSQALRGFAAGAGEARELDAATLAAALGASADAAYRAVAVPVEGTMLTILRAAAAAAVKSSATLPGGVRGASPASVLDAALRAAEHAEALTPTQLPALAEAGVTDSGGEGICVILRGLAAALAGEAPPAALTAITPPLLGQESSHSGEEFGFCTEFILEPAGDAPLDVAGVRELAADGNRSVVVVGDASALRVHVHTDAPELLLARLGSLGRLSRVKVDDMNAQNRRFSESGSGATARIAVLAFSPGSGFDVLFASYGCATAPLGLAKPTAGEIARAAGALRVPDVIVLPNHKDVIMAAQQAAGIAPCTLHIVPSRTLPAGIAAAFSFQPQHGPPESVAAMTRALGGVRAVEVTYAGATRTVSGVDVAEGDAIVLVDGELVAAESTLVAALLAGLGAAGAPEASLITLFVGADVDAALAGEASRAVQERFPGAEFEQHGGGQPLYPFIASVER